MMKEDKLFSVLKNPRVKLKFIPQGYRNFAFCTLIFELKYGVLKLLRRAVRRAQAKIGNL